MTPLFKDLTPDAQQMLRVAFETIWKKHGYDTDFSKEDFVKEAINLVDKGYAVLVWDEDSNALIFRATQLGEQVADALGSLN